MVNKKEEPHKHPRKNLLDTKEIKRIYHDKPYQPFRTKQAVPKSTAEMQKAQLLKKQHELKKTQNMRLNQSEQLPTKKYYGKNQEQNLNVKKVTKKTETKRSQDNIELTKTQVINLQEIVNKSVYQPFQTKKKKTLKVRVGPQKENKNIVVSGNFARVKLTGAILKFNNLYSIKRRRLQILIVASLAILFGLIGVIFLQNTGLYDYGLASIPQGIGRLAYFLIIRNNPGNENFGYLIFNLLFWGLYFIANIPLIIFGFFKVGKRFSELTTYFLLVSSISGIAFGFIPNINNFFIFSNLDHNAHPVLIQHFIRIILWNFSNDASSVFSIFIYAFVFALFNAFLYAILLIIDASTGGFDFLGVYYAQTRHKDFGKILVYINIVTFVTAIIIGSYIPTSLALRDYYDAFGGGVDPNFIDPGVRPFEVSILFSPNFVSSIIMNLIFAFVLNVYFPKYKIAKVEIYSSRVDQIVNALATNPHPFTISIHKLIGGYSRTEQTMMITTCLFLDTPYLLKIVRSIDKTCLFTVNFINHVDGYIFLASNKNIEKFSFKKRNKN